MSEILNFGRENLAFKQLRKRSAFLFLLIALFGSITFFQIIKLTILDSNLYTTKSDENRIIRIPIYPSRGLIKLSNGEIVVENIVTQALTIVPNKTSDLERTLEELKQNLGLKDEELLTFKRKLSKTKYKYDSIVIVENLTKEQIARFSVEKEKWPSVSIKAQLMRFNLLGPIFSHVTGYVGLVSPEEIDESEDFSYPFTSQIGKTGVEKFYEGTLRGGEGFRTIEIDAYGKEVRELARFIPEKGKDIYLSLDKELQVLARNELAGRKGAVVALDPNTGLIKALVSSPDFSPNILNKTETGKVENILIDSQSPLFNRAISGNYPPASTLKPFIGLLGVKEKKINWTTTIEDQGFFQIDGKGRKYRGWKEDGHGTVNLSKSIIESSDVFFYHLATQLTVDSISNFLKQFGFGRKTGVDLSSETEGLLPDRKWKLGAIGESWFVGDTINISIGQGYISCSPLQLALAVSSIATKGKVYRPRVVAKIEDQFTEKQVIYHLNQIEKSHWEKLENSMVSVISHWKGTAHNLTEFGQETIAGKTGTAQIKSLTDAELTIKEEYEDIRLEERNRDHALFVGYGPLPDPELTVVVIVENGESGSTVAAPIAQRLIDFYADRED